MCGIVGFTGVEGAEGLLAMNRVQSHRGPDDRGSFSCLKNRVHLAMRRLSIIDPKGGAQPMPNRDASLWIVHNGEIFNAPALREYLQAKGVVFKTDHSDTEVLLHLYEREGENILRRINGMFSFVIYDKKKRILFGARDPFGIKPLFYTKKPGRFAFASELKSLRELEWVSSDIDPQAAWDYFTCQTIPSPLTSFHDIKKIPAGTCFTLDLNKDTLRLETYWNPARIIGSEPTSHPHKEEIRERFKDAVLRWTLSDVPVACSLSGGIDSAAVVGALASESSAQIKTFSLGFENCPDLDERDLARQVSEKWKTEHHEIVIRADDLLGELNKMLWHLDEPYGGGLPSWFVFKQMATEVKVCMTGTGGDELFGNYGKWRAFSGFGQYKRAAKRYFKRGGSVMDLIFSRHGVLHYPYFTDGEKRRSLFLHETSSGTRSSAGLIESYWREPAYSNRPRDRVMLADMRLQLPEEFLMMTDRFSMAHSIEARVPFLDREFATFIMSLKADRRTKSGTPLKKVFIDAISDLLPPALLSAPKKGFILPFDRWLKGRLRPLVETFLSENYLKQQGLFRHDLFNTVALPYYDGIEKENWPLWTLLMFQLWYERNIMQRRISC